MGVQLTGIEAKSCRQGNVLIQDGFSEVRDGELWLLNVHIPELKRAGPRQVHEPKRVRKLLAKKKEILKLEQRMVQQNMVSTTSICMFIFLFSCKFTTRHFTTPSSH